VSGEGKQPVNPGLEDGQTKSALIRELVGLSQFTDGILRTLASAVILIRADGRVVYVNPAAESLLRRPAADMLDGPIDSVLVNRSGACALGAAPYAEEAMGEVDLRLVDGSVITVDMRLTRHSGDEGEDVGGVVAILTDRTEVKMAEQAARRKERLASIGELSAGVAHEIRNPLAGIGASAQLLKARLAEDARNEKLAEVILEEVARLDRIVESLLRFARPPEPALQEASLECCLDRALRMVRPDAESLGITVTEEMTGDLPRVWIDPDQIEQVLLNLLRNAVQAMEEERGGALRVAVRKVRRRPYVRRRAGRREDDAGLPRGQVPAQDWIEAEISDTGAGIPTEVLDRVFDPFYTTRKRGTGLGLAISQAIVQEHNGMMSISSAPGTGTTVLVDLPIERRRGRRRSP
jgi:nitrogen-specific signal transduction histidine kinase